MSNALAGPETGAPVPVPPLPAHSGSGPGPTGLPSHIPTITLPRHGAPYLIEGGTPKLTGPGGKHKLIVRAGTSQPGSAPITFESAQEAVQHLQQVIAAAEASHEQPPGRPTPITATYTIATEPQPVA